MQVDRYLHMDLSSPSRSRTEQLLKGAADRNYRTALLSGRALQDNGAFLELCQLLGEHAFTVFVRTSPASLIRNSEAFADEKLAIQGAILEIDDGLPGDAREIFEAASQLESAGKSVGVLLRVSCRSSHETVAEWLRVLSALKVTDLILESTPDYMEQEDTRKEQYFQLFMRYRAFLERLHFQCSFLEEFRPSRCLYMDPALPILLYQQDGLTICPHHARFSFRQPCSEDPFDALPSLIGIKKELQIVRLNRYARLGKPFFCGDCIREGEEFLRKPATERDNHG